MNLRGAGIALIVTLMAATQASLVQAGEWSSKTVPPLQRGTEGREARHLSEKVKLRPDVSGMVGMPGDSFGNSVAVCGDVAVVGTVYSDLSAANGGMAAVFVRRDGSWELENRLTAPAGIDDHHFGVAVAVSENTIAVGAPDGYGNAGAVYVFARDGDVWALAQTLLPEQGAVGDGFGRSLAISDDTIVVGGFESVYLYVRAGSQWRIEQRFLAENPDEFSSFGTSVAFDRSGTIVIGAPTDSRAALRGGAVYVFARDGSDWSLMQIVTAPDPEIDEHFGSSVALSSSTLLVGVPWAGEAGEVHVFELTGNTWVRAQVLVPSDPAEESSFGASLALEDDISVIGSPGVSQAAYVFELGSTGWTERARLTTALQHRSGFGYSVALSNETAVVGSPYDDTFGRSAGLTSVFVRNPAAWEHEQNLVGPADSAWANFGSSVSVFGNTAVVGTEQADFEEGAAWIFVHENGQWAPVQTVTTPNPDTAFGASVSIYRGTAVVGAPGDDDTAEGSGAAYVLERLGDEWVVRHKLKASDAQENVFFGESVLVTDDRIFVGAERDDAPQLNSGSVYVFEWSDGVWTEVQKLVGSDAGRNDLFGSTLSASGERLVVGAPSDAYGWPGHESGNGAAYVFEYSFGRWRETHCLTSEGSWSDSGFGNAVSI